MTGHDATAYYADLTPTGAWQFSRYRNKTDLVDGRDRTLGAMQGEVRHLRLDCAELPTGEVQLAFYVDDRQVAGFTDHNSVPPGDVGVAASAYTPEPFAVTFRDFRVYGP